MSINFLLKQRGHRIIVFLGILLLGVLLAVAGMQVVLLKINQNREKMVTKLRQEFGFPLTLDTIEARWFGLSLGVSVRNVVVQDPSAPIGFVAIENIDLLPNISSLLFKNELYFKKIVLQQLRMVIGWDNKNDLSILGLKGELLPTSIDYASVLALLSKLQTIVVDSADIEWRGPTIQIKQSLRGEFDWVQTKTIDWKFVGTQQLQIREDFKIPEFDFNLSVSPNLQGLALKIGRGNSYAECDLQVSEDKKWQVDCKSEAKQLNLAEIRHYYHPTKTDFPLLQWLFNALPKGKITEAKVGIKGPIDNLKKSGEILFKGTDFEYTHGWPKIEKATGVVTIENDRVMVQLSKGFILGSPIQAATARILPIGSNEKTVVYVEGELDSTLEKGLLFLQKSPLRDSVAEHLKTLNPKGPMHLNLKCEIPLDAEPVKVDGTVLVKGGQIDVPDWDKGLTALNGAFRFSTEGLEASNVMAHFASLPIVLDVKTLTVAKQKTLEVTANTTFSSAFLQQHFRVPVLQKLHGQSLFSLVVKKPLELNKSSQTEWHLNSDLQGMKIDLPGFLGKTEKEQRPMTLKVGTEIKGERKIALQMSNRWDAKFVTIGPVDHLNIKRGHIVFGKKNADWPSKDRILVGGEIENFKTEEWLDFFDEIKVSNQKKLPPLDIHLLINRLEIFGLRFDKTQVSTNFGTLPLKWQLDGPQIKGTFSGVTETVKQTEIDFDYLRLSTHNFPLETKIASHLASFEKVPINFYCKDLQYEKGNFGEVSFRLVPAVFGYRIQDLLVETRKSELSGNGEWHLRGEEGVYTTLQGTMTSTNMGETLSRWDYPTAIRESSGTIQYQFRWPKHPFQFKLGIVDGTAELKFDKGRILGVNPGIGRIMGLLNFENIHRRLQLDFSDLLKKGFVFDTLKGNFQFQKGVAKTEKLTIDGPSAKITLVGKANMNTKAIDLEMAVTPHIEVGIPLAAAIAVGNPAVGAGLWIIDKLTGSKINKITRHHYHVTGTWESPSIVESTSKPATPER